MHGFKRLFSIVAIAGMLAMAFAPSAFAAGETLTMTPWNVTLTPGQTVQESVTDSVYGDVTAKATYVMDTNNVATVTTNGAVTAIGPGTASFTAWYDGIGTSANVTVLSGPTLTGITVAPLITLIPGQTKSLTVTAYFSDGSTKDVTSQAAYEALPSNATMTVPGTFTPEVNGYHFAGDTTDEGVVAFGAFTQTFNVRTLGLKSTSPNSVTYMPDPVFVGSSQALVATATFSDGETANLTPMGTWTAYANSIASLSSSGVLTGVQEGTFVASSGFSVGGTSFGVVDGISATAYKLSVTLPLSSPSAILQTGGTLQIKAIVSDGNNPSFSQNVTNTALYTVYQPSVISVSSGLITAKAVGIGNLTVTDSAYGVSAGPYDIQVIPSLTGLVVSPTVVTLQSGGMKQETVTAVYSDGSTQDVSTSAATWNSANSSIATVTTGGAITAVAAGSTTVTASYQGQTAQVAVTVTVPSPLPVPAPVSPPSLSPSSPRPMQRGSSPPVSTTANQPTLSVVSLTAFPDHVTLAQGGYLQPEVQANYTGSTVRTVMVQNLCAWSSAHPSVASVTTGGVNNGMIRAVAPGKTTVTATYQGHTAQIAVTVTGLAPAPTPTRTGPTVSPTASQSQAEKAGGSTRAMSNTSAIGTIKASATPYTPPKMPTPEPNQGTITPAPQLPTPSASVKAPPMFEDRVALLPSSTQAGSKATYTYIADVQPYSAVLDGVSGITLTAGGAADFSIMSVGEAVEINLDGKQLQAHVEQIETSKVVLGLPHMVTLKPSDHLELALNGQNTKPGMYKGDMQYILLSGNTAYQRYLPLSLAANPVLSTQNQTVFFGALFLLLVSISLRVYALLRLIRHDRTV